MKKKGFTLIELLAVIIILAIIALIAVPQIIKILNKTRRSAAEDSTYGIVKASETYTAKFMLQNNGNFPNEDLEFNCDGTNCELQTELVGYNLEGLDKLEFKGSTPSGGTITISDSGKEVVASELIIKGFVCNYPVEEKASCLKSGEVVTTTRGKLNGQVTPPTPKTLIYNGTSQELINAGSSSTGTIEYKIGEDGTYSTSIPSETNPGTYKVYYRVIGDETHKDIAERSINVMIKKADNTLTISESSGELTYPATKTITVTNPNNLTLTCESSNTNAATCSVDGNNVTITSGTTAATSVTMTIESAETEYYKKGQVTYLVTSKLGTISVTANDVTLEADGNAHGITVSATPNDAVIKYMDSEGNYTLEASPTITEIGTLVVYYQVTKEGYATVIESKTVTLTAPIIRYKFGNPTSTSPTDYTQVKYPNNTQAKVFVKLQGSQKSVCMIYNGELECFKSHNYENERTHLQEGFVDATCYQYSDAYQCGDAEFFCDVKKDGTVLCGDKSTGYYCRIYNNGSGTCDKLVNVS